MHLSQELVAAANRLEHWIKHHALPLWQRVGFDRAHGGHYERLLPTGAPDLESSVRVRVQARQAFFYAVSFDRGWCPEGKQHALNLMRFIRQYATHPSAVAGYTHLLDKNFSLVDTKQDLYDHAFFILANTWCYRAFGDEAALYEAEVLVEYLDNNFGTENGGWIEGDYPYACRRQNPHMHLFEAFMALYDATKNTKWLFRVGKLFNLFETRFFDSKQQVLYEFFEDDWSRSKGQRGEIVEPGHMMEWVWLLDWYHRRSGKAVKKYTHALYNKAFEIGVDKQGLLYDAVAPDGRIIDANKRCWGLTEYIKASLVQVRAGDINAPERVLQGVDNLFKYYLCATTPGSFVDQRGAQNELLVDFAPASTLYHIIVAATELIDHCHSPEYSKRKA